jgi:halimadienyl-diphosphate synthase
METRNSWIANANSAIAKLVAEMSADPAGQFSVSVYETARLVSLAPDAAGHLRRIRFLLAGQQEDGDWGGPDDYGLVPLLSATESLLTVLFRPTDCDENHTLHQDVLRAADRGLRAVFRRINRHQPVLPPTFAADVIVPALIGELNAHLDRLEAKPLAGLEDWLDDRRLAMPAIANTAQLARLRHAAGLGHPLPEKLVHALEAIGPQARGADFATPVDECVGCSPAATAIWLGNEGTQGNRYLAEVQEPGTGAVPTAAPVAFFERTWVLAALAGAGLPVPGADVLVASLHAAFGEFGAAAGPGLPPDADDTATALYALALLESPRDPSCLWGYQSGEHFSCFPGEQSPSTATNAHVLQALGTALDGPERTHCRTAMASVRGWLCEQQDSSGRWWDRWHASPFYATACCTAALTEHGGDAGAAAAHRAVAWVLAAQHSDGSWGEWDGTAEETAYALKILLRAKESGWDEAIGQAAARGAGFLLDRAGSTDCPPLWHDKDLYAPARIVRAEVLAALHLAHTDRRVAPLLSRDHGREAS